MTTPTLAVTVVLWRRSQISDEIEIYLGHRADTMRFVPGQWTFPGGAIGPEDERTAITGATGLLARNIAAAIREVREETGVELPARADRFTPIGRLVTPDIFPVRFDASFYLVELEPDVVVDYRASQGELQDGTWTTPRAASAAAAAGHWLIPEPTLAIIQALAAGIDGASDRCHAVCERMMRKPRVYQLVPGIWFTPVRTPTLPPATATNCYIVGGTELVVIDPASPYDAERAELDRAIASLQDEGQHVVEIWLTHHHGDHVGGAAHLSERLGIPIAAHRATAERLGTRVPVSRYLDDGDTRDLPGDLPRRLEVVFTPGHAPGHICILETHTGFMIAGDMVAGLGTILIEPTEGDMRLYMDSLRRMRTLAPRALLPAHGPPIDNPAAKIDEYLEHRLWREQRVLDAVRTCGPAPTRELVKLAYSDAPPMIHPLAERSLIAHLHKLEQDGLATRDEATQAHPRWRLT